jgi:hypothetical protein
MTSLDRLRITSNHKVSVSDRRGLTTRESKSQQKKNGNMTFADANRKGLINQEMMGQQEGVRRSLF